MERIVIDTSKISKTTIHGVLTLALAGVIAASSMPPGSKWPAVAICALKAMVSYYEKDADLQNALQPDGSVGSVPAHTTPDDPKDIPVSGK